MIADVPVGVLLSGGVDSTAVLSFAVERTDKEVSSYTVGFSDPGVADERPYAKLAADTFGTKHHDMTISAASFADFMPTICVAHGRACLRAPRYCPVLRLEVGAELCEGSPLGRGGG